MTPVFTLCFFLPVIARNKVTKQSVLLFRKLTCHCEEHSDEAIRFSFYALPGYGSRRSARDDTGFYVVLLLTCRCGEQSDEAIRFSLYVLPGYGSRRFARDDTGFYVALLLTCHCEERSDEAIRSPFTRSRGTDRVAPLAMTPVFTLHFYLPVIARNAVTKQSVSPFTRSRGTDRVAPLAMTPVILTRGINLSTPGSSAQSVCFSSFGFRL